MQSSTLWLLGVNGSFDLMQTRHLAAQAAKFAANLIVEASIHPRDRQAGDAFAVCAVLRTTMVGQRREVMADCAAFLLAGEGEGAKVVPSVDRRR